MKRILLSLALVSTLLSACGGGSNAQNANAQKGADMAKLLAMQAQLTDSLPPLVDIDQRRVDIPFITKGDTVSVRPVHMFIPQTAKKPMPVVYIPHYEMKDDALELRQYLAEGWADPLRILMVGGSAGGYMSMMLAGLQMGICASVANAPIENVYFNFYQHFNAADKVNGGSIMKVMLKHAGKLTKGTDEEKMQALMEAIMEIPLPFAGLVSGSFKPIQDNFPDKEDYARWAALSPIGLTDCYSNPFIIYHCTSDLLVPIDQTTRKYTYEKNSDSMPKKFSTRLDASNPGILGKALDELLDPSLTRVESFKPVPVGETASVSYDVARPFNINVSDDGPVESYSSHNNGNPQGAVDMIPYLKDMVTRSLASTELLRPGKVRLLLERYAGRSVQLPAHEGIDDSAYGSLKVYQDEVVEELGRYAGNHSVKEIDEMVASFNDASLSETWKEIKERI